MVDNPFKWKTEDEVKQIYFDLYNNREKRLIMTKKSLFLFTLYYLGHYFKNAPASFHKEMCADLSNDELQMILFIMFRWSAKTTFVKADFLRNIVFWLRRMMFWSSADWVSAWDNLFDIAVNLQSNRKILADFWELYWSSKEEVRTSKKTSVYNFHTSNWVRVMATAIWGSLRWKNFDWERIDYIVYDDIETNVTIRSASTTLKTIKYIDESLTALGPNSKVIVLWNRISDIWVIAYLEQKLKDVGRTAKVLEKAAIEKGNSTWPERYLLTDKEYFSFTLEERKYLFSLETIRRTSNTNWKKVFEQEYLNQPMVDWDRFFDIPAIDQRLKQLEWQIKKVQWNWVVYKWLQKESGRGLCRYLIWVDVSEWYWMDHSVIEVINLDTWEQVAEFCSNLVPPDQLVDEIIWAHKKYNKATIVPERNSIWSAVINLLKSRGYGGTMPVQTTIDKVKNVKIQKFWWNTNRTSKPKMLFNFQKEFNEWIIIINSIPLLKEMRSYTNNDIWTIWFDEEVSNHFDRVMAMAIANEHRSYWEWFHVNTKTSILHSMPDVKKPYQWSIGYENSTWLVPLPKWQILFD